MNAADLKAQLRARVAHFEANPLPDLYVPANAWEAAKHREFEAYGRSVKPITERTAQAEKTGLDPFAPPASSDFPPEITAHYRELAHRFNDLRALERDESLEIALEADRDAAAAEAFKELEDIKSLRDSAYIHHVKNRMGEVISEDAWKRSSEGQAQLEEDSIDIALRLESAGRPALGSGPQAWLVDPISGMMKPSVNVRNRAIIPCAAAKKRAPTIAALELLLGRDDHRFDQFCTFTGGKRVSLRIAKSPDFIGPDFPAGWHVRQGFIQLHRDLSKLNGKRFMERFGARMIFRASEIGSLISKEGVHNKDEHGNWTIHPHAHVLIHFERFLQKSEMRAWTRAVWAAWGRHWSVDGAIEKVREACKYVVKPADQKRLSTPELAALDAALFRLHRVQPLGDLKEGIRYRRENCLAIKRFRLNRRNDDGERSCELVPFVVPDANAQKKNRIPTEEEIVRKKRRTERLIARRAAEAANAITGDEGASPDMLKLARWNPDTGFEWYFAADPQGDVPKRKTPLGEKPSWRNRIVARLSPAPYFDRVATPAVLVWSDTRPDIDIIRAHPVVAQILAAAKEAVVEARAAVAAGLHKDTQKQSRADGSGNESSHQYRKCPTPSGARTRTGHLPGLLKPETWQKQPAELAETR